MFEVDAVKVRGLMFENKYNVQDLEKVAGISKVTAAKVIREGTKVTFTTLRKLADAFHVNGNSLILSK